MKITIGLPVFNGERFIRRALQSVLDQTFQDFEIVISDNASTDKTQEICDEFLRRDTRIRYIKQHKNRGWYFNFNKVAGEAKGRYFTWLAHDDELCPQFLEEMITYLDAHPASVLVASDFTFIDEGGAELRVVRLDRLRRDISWPERRIAFFEYPGSNINFSVYVADILRIIMKQVADIDGIAGGELPMLCAAACLGEICSVPLTLRQYRRHK